MFQDIIFEPWNGIHPSLGELNKWGERERERTEWRCCCSLAALFENQTQGPGCTLGVLCLSAATFVFSPVQSLKATTPTQWNPAHTETTNTLDSVLYTRLCLSPTPCCAQDKASTSTGLIYFQYPHFTLTYSVLAFYVKRCSLWLKAGSK